MRVLVIRIRYAAGARVAGTKITAGIVCRALIRRKLFHLALPRPFRSMRRYQDIFRGQRVKSLVWVFIRIKIHIYSRYSFASLTNCAIQLLPGRVTPPAKPAAGQHRQSADVRRQRYYTWVAPTVSPIGTDSNKTTTVQNDLLPGAAQRTASIKFLTIREMRRARLSQFPQKMKRAAPRGEAALFCFKHKRRHMT